MSVGVRETAWSSDDGSGIWCSKGTIQRHTELGETTVKRTVREFLKEGILVETGARACKNGFTVVYRIDLAKVEALGRWRSYIDDIVKGREETKAKEAEMLSGLANWVTDKHPLCRAEMRP